MASEAQVQSSIWHFEVGRGRRVVGWVLTLLVAITLSLLYTAFQFRGLEQRAAMDNAQLARNIARGEGFTTYLIRPLSLWQLRESAPDHNQRLLAHPDLVNPPLYPLALAGLFKLLPEKFFAMGLQDRVYTPERWVIVPFGQLCLLLSLWLVYLWAKQIFDARVATTAGLLLLFSDVLWSYSISGLPTSFLMLLLIGTLYALFLADRALHPETEGAPAATGRGTALLLLSAVLLGLCGLTQYRTLWLVLPLALYVWRIRAGRQGWFWAALYAAVALAVVSPWLVRNFRICGNPFGIVLPSLLGGEWAQRSYHPELDDFYSLNTWLRNLVTGVRSNLLDVLPESGHSYFFYFFAVGLLYGFRRSTVTRLRGALLGCLGVMIVAMALIPMPAGWREQTAAEGNLFVLLVPVLAVYGVAFFYLLLDRIQFETRLARAAVVAVFAIINVAAMIGALLPPRRGMFVYPPYIAPYTAMVAKWFEPAEVGASDLPWAMAWVGDRRTVWLPGTVADFVEINDYADLKQRFSFMFVTPYMLDRRYQTELLKGDYREWSGLLRGQLPSQFPLQAAVALPPAQEQILFADRPRWMESAMDPSAPLPGEKRKPQPPATNAPPASSLN